MIRFAARDFAVTDTAGSKWVRGDDPKSIVANQVWAGDFVVEGGCFKIKLSKELVPGAKLYLECHWDNPGEQDVNWGESTSNEMCLAPYYVTE